MTIGFGVGLEVGFLTTGLGLGGVGFVEVFARPVLGVAWASGADLGFRRWWRGCEFKNMNHFGFLLAARKEGIYEKAQGKNKMPKQGKAEDSPFFLIHSKHCYLYHHPLLFIPCKDRECGLILGLAGRCGNQPPSTSFRKSLIPSRYFSPPISGRSLWLA